MAPQHVKVLSCWNAMSFFCSFIAADKINSAFIPHAFYILYRYIYIYMRVHNMRVYNMYNLSSYISCMWCGFSLHSLHNIYLHAEFFFILFLENAVNMDTSNSCKFSLPLNFRAVSMVGRQLAAIGDEINIIYSSDFREVANILSARGCYACFSITSLAKK